MGNNLLITTGALVILGTFILTANHMMMNNTQVGAENEYYLTALSLGQSVIDEAKTKAFDQKVLTGFAATPSSLTHPDSLGTDGSAESVPSPDTLITSGYRSVFKFNDVDDYNKYSRTVNTDRLIGYLVNVTVTYASPTYPDSSKTTRTYCKMMTVTVTHSLLSTPMTLSYAFTY